ncbi:SAM-dependent methyltransferase [Nocardia sp. NPDC127526]|uniref:SAM-dependent methyltransferase n=1 Tax=Nocardia sp. NPDC127526 TaxID=3345393 RepID=UPI003639F6D8
MTGNRPQAPIAGVAMTAIGVAVIRARESERADRLYDDPLARVFADAAARSFDPARWQRLEALADQFYEGRSVGVRLVDDGVRAALDAGCRQIVLIGAGLDTRAFRMEWPEGVRLFEIDLPELFAFKEPVLEQAGATPRCERRVIAADLRGDWPKQLVANGFRADEPTHWIDEGVLGYLNEDARGVVEKITEIAAPRSRFGFGRFAVDANSGPYTELRRMVAGDTAQPQSPVGLGPDAEQWLTEIGWDTEFHSWDDLVAPYGRPVAVNDPAVGMIRAIRR